MRGMPEQIRCRLGPGTTHREIHDQDFDAVLRHPARQARLGYRALLLCDTHDVVHKTTRRCEHCRALDGQILGAKVNCPDWARADADRATALDEKRHREYMADRGIKAGSRRVKA